VTSGPPRIWVLLGHRRGDNNQLLALAEALGLPFETRTLSYRRLWALYLRLLPAAPALLDRDSRRMLAEPWPDLVIGIGRRSVAVARWIKRRSGGRTRLVRLGNPRADPSLFDLVITTSQYPVPAAPNVLVLPLALARNAHVAPTADEAAWLAELPRPHLLFSLGGTTRYWEFPVDAVAAAAATLAERADASGGSLIVASSPRTPAAALDAVSSVLDGRANCRLVTDGAVRFPVLIGDADEHVVTADSVSMISEAVLTGKPVALVPVALDAEGERRLGRRGSSPLRDLRRFWASLHEQGLVGTIAAPRTVAVEPPIHTAAAAVLKLLGDRVE
jgi:uncharacterized protein